MTDREPLAPYVLFFTEGTATWLGGRLESRAGSDAAAERRLLDALLGR